MRLLLLLICASILFIPVVALAQEQDYQVVKSDKSESFVLPYTASNQDKDSPLVYTFETPKQPSWILSIQNNLSYAPSDDSKTIIRINEPAPMPATSRLKYCLGALRSRRFILCLLV